MHAWQLIAAGEACVIAGLLIWRIWAEREND